MPSRECERDKAAALIISTHFPLLYMLPHAKSLCWVSPGAHIRSHRRQYGREIYDIVIMTPFVCRLRLTIA